MKKLVICAGPTAVGKTSVLRHVIRKLLAKNICVAYLKNDVQYATDATMLAEEFGIHTATEYSGEFCPDHASVTTLYGHIQWAWAAGAEVLLVETAGLCLRCAPYALPGESLGIVVLEETSGIDLPFKIGPMLTLADVAMITKIDMVSQAEREIFLARTRVAAPKVRVWEVNAQAGIGIDPLIQRILSTPDLVKIPTLRGNPPLGTCTVCSGERSMDPKKHRGVVAITDGGMLFSGQ
jgi:Ni2+-binding GTPase involved in maturation of urease and hydrogenase